MELGVEAALGVGDGGDVENDGLPFEAAAPHESLQPQIQVRTGLHQQLHHRATVVLVAVDGVEERSVAAQSDRVDVGADVHVDPGGEEHRRTARRVVFSTHVQGRHAAQRRVRTLQGQAAMGDLGIRRDQDPEPLLVVEQDRFQQIVADRRARLEHDPHAVTELR
jgi:hypothetical protein